MVVKNVLSKGNAIFALMTFISMKLANVFETVHKVIQKQITNANNVHKTVILVLLQVSALNAKNHIFFTMDLVTISVHLA